MCRRSSAFFPALASAGAPPQPSPAGRWGRCGVTPWYISASCPSSRKGEPSVKCPYCNHPESKVVDSRPADEGNSIRRRRECLECHRRFTTYETMESLPLVVIKRDGSRQAFDKSKLLNSMLKVCEKRSVPLYTLEDITESIEQSLQNDLEREIPSTEIGERVMERLKDVDEVAYVRFASVYRQFRDISSFMEELSRLLQER